MSWEKLAANGHGRRRLPFRSVNRRDRPGHAPGMQRHHLLPLQLLSLRSLRPLFEALGRCGLHFDDFRRNGLLLPASGEAALRIGLPLHRGPHGSYNTMVADRVGQIEAEWSRQFRRTPEIALGHAVMRIELLQQALRRRLLKPARHPLRLNRRDPIGNGHDFTQLDAMADELWGGTEIEASPDAANLL